MVRRRPLPPQLDGVLPRWSQLDGIGESILAAVATDLNQPRRWLVDMMDPACQLGTATSASLLRLLHYLPGRDGTGVAEHHDVGLLSILPPSSRPALEVLDLRSMRWHAAELDSGSDRAVVMVGRALEVLSGDTYNACVHRVRASTGGRDSIVFQIRPHPTATVHRASLQPTPQPPGWADPVNTGAELMRYVRHGLESVNAS